MVFMRESDPRGRSKKYVLDPPLGSLLLINLSDFTFRLHFWIRLSDHSFRLLFPISLLDHHLGHQKCLNRQLLKLFFDKLTSIMR